MRSDNLKTHMKQHEKRNEAYPTTKRKLEDDDELRKLLQEITVEYDCKIALGKRIYKILERGKVKECALPKDM